MAVLAALSACTTVDRDGPFTELAFADIDVPDIETALPFDTMGAITTGGISTPALSGPGSVMPAHTPIPDFAGLMSDGESIGASPRPWLEFCRRDPSRTQCANEPTVVEATTERLHQLVTVQNMVHQHTHQRPDAVEIGDNWELIGRSRYGDCEDMALTKRDILMTWGWPAGSLRPAICMIDQEPGAPSQLHAVLTVDTTKGTYVLGNLHEGVRTIDTSECKDWVMRSNGVNWSWIEGGATIPLQPASHKP
ncbi:MAG: transglutaminase-like cysteine peptidase [Pseudomonadota bacterium]